MKEDIVPTTSAEIEFDSKKDFLERFKNKYKEESLPEAMSTKDKDRILEITNDTNTRQTLFTSIPMVCRGSACDMAKVCPLFQEGIAPVGQRCPIEYGVIETLVSGLMDELGIRPEDTVDLLQLRDLVNQEVQLLRAMNILAQDSVIQENTVGIDSDGDPITQKQLHLATDLEDKLHRRKNIILKQLMASREAKAKVGLDMLDSAQTMANTFHNFKKMKEEADKALKKKLGILDNDDYIEAKEARKREEAEKQEE